MGWQGRMTVSASNHNRRIHTRHPYEREARVVAGGREHAGRIQDISRGGASLLLNSSIGNDAFVDLHVEGVGRIPSQVVRQFDRGVGVEFDLSDEAREIMAAAEGKSRPKNRKTPTKPTTVKDDPLTDTVKILFEFIDSLKGPK